jgi:glycosyltransferase involved in cell wall biosynthesis
MNLKSHNYGLFLTYGSSLSIWQKNGVFERELEFYKKISPKFNKVFIVSYGGKDEQFFLEALPRNFEILYKRIFFPNLLYQFLIPLVYYKKLKSCEIIKTNQIFGSLAAVLTKLICRKPLLIARGGYLAYQVERDAHHSFISRLHILSHEKAAYKFCDQAVITSQPQADFLKRNYPALKDKITVIGNVIMTNIFKPVAAKKKYDIGYVGRLESTHKQPLTILKASLNTNWRICFIGQGPDYEMLQEFARSNGLDLTIYKKVNNYQLPDYYNSFRIFAFPSRAEGNPKTLLEAMSCGLPIVTTNAPGINNIVENGLNGLLVDLKHENWREKMIYLLNNNDSTKNLGFNARDYVVANHSFDTIFFKEMTLYEKITK